MGSTTEEKYAGILKEGLSALARRAVEEFPGFLGLEDRFNVSMIFDPSSRAVFEQRVAEPITRIEEDLRLEFLIGDRDYPMHSTVLGAGCRDESMRTLRFWRALNNPRLSAVSNQLLNLCIEFDQFLFNAKGAILLAASFIPPVVIEARQQLQSYYQEQDLEPSDMRNILHITAARATILPQKEDREGWLEYKKQLLSLRNLILVEHLQLTVGSDFMGRVIDLLKFFQDR